MKQAEEAVTLRVEVRDTGVGIPAVVQQKLFQPFTQGDGSLTRRFGGTGLGLAICRQLVDLMQGRIGCESQVGAGSVFWFELDLPKTNATLPEPPSQSPFGGRVLVVDDNATSRNLLVTQIAEFGGSATPVESPRLVLDELIKAAQRGAPYEAVLLDYDMPEMGGVTLAKSIRQNAVVSKTPLVLLSSGLASVSHSTLISARLDATLEKPVMRKQLRRTLSRVLSRSSLTPPLFDKAAAKPNGPTGIHVLLVEDNRSNQLVASMMLEHHGHSVEIASNGQEALEKLALRRFDVVLMDCQMPVLDGYEATARVRTGAVAGLNVRIPIIALTAHAMASDRARCMAAGMDDYVSKPFEMSTLEAAFARCGVLRKTAPREIPGNRTDPENVVLDPSHIEQLTQLRGPSGDTLARDVAALFKTEMPGRLAMLEDFVARQRTEEAARAAHTLAGSCASLGAKRLRLLVKELESAVKEADWTEAAAKLELVKAGDAELGAELSRLKLL